MNYREIATYIRARVLHHLQMAWRLAWAGHHRLASAAREFAMRLRAQLVILRAAAGA